MESAVKFLASLFVLDGGSQTVDQQFGIGATESLKDSLNLAAPTSLPVADSPVCPYAPAAKMVCPAASYSPPLPIPAGAPPFPTLFMLDLKDNGNLEDAW